ncbi:hypothetical protein KIPB_016584, partial [Kipferlia bialata]
FWVSFWCLYDGDNSYAYIENGSAWTLGVEIRMAFLFPFLHFLIRPLATGATNARRMRKTPTHRCC